MNNDISNSILRRHIETWASPVEEDNFCGQDVSFADDFEALREEVDKEISLYGGTATDWELVLRLASRTLAEQGKDLWAFCYAVRAAFALEGVSGVADALEAANAVFERHWDGLFPPKEKIQRRCAPFLWLGGKLESLLPPESFTHLDVCVVEKFRLELKRLQDLLDAALGEAAAAFLPVLRVIPELESAKDPTPDASGEPGASGAEHGQQASNRPPPSLLTSSELLKAIDGDGRVPSAILPQLLRATQEQAQQLAVHYLSSDVTDWRAYYLHRAAVWATINQLPQANAANVTQLRPLPFDKSSAYTAAVNSRQYAAVLPQLERSAGKAPFWLDGHVLVARCLEALEAKAAHQTLCLAFARFVERFPELLHLKFYDGTPFASDAVQEWIRGLIQKASSPASEHAAPAASASSDAPREDSLETALREFSENGFFAGLDALGRIPAGKNRASVAHALLRARYCLAAGRPRAAQQLLAALYERLAEWELLDWEPELTGSVISLLSSTGRSQKGELSDDIMRRLHWLHLDTALKISKE